MADLYDQLRRKYMDKLRESLRDSPSPRTAAYDKFRQQYLPKPLSWYEKLCRFSASIVPIAPDKKKAARMQEAIEATHLQLKPEGVMAFSFVIPILFIMASALLFFVLPVLLGREPNMFVMAYCFIAGAIAIIPLGNVPMYIAQNWRMRASNQMVLCTFYIVTYMRHTSNLELAIDFAAEHLSPPMNLDMKKVLWNVETEKFDSLKESLENYLERWRESNGEFVEALHLIEGSLVETTEDRRLQTLEKSLTVILDETYEKMLHYAHDLKGPLTTLHMLGIILPILGLVILPLMVSFMTSVRWYHIAILYNVTLPLMVYFIGQSVLSKRPTGYGSSDQDEDTVAAAAQEAGIAVKKRLFSPFFIGAVVFLMLLLVGSIPLLIHAATKDPLTGEATWDLIHTGNSRKDSEPGCIFQFCPVDPTDDRQMDGALYRFNEYREITVNEDTGETLIVGPFGLIATLLSLFVPLGVGLGFGLYYHMRSGQVLKLRKKAAELETEFASALFQLGNRLADGLPLEIAFSRVAMMMRGTLSGDFFAQVSTNVTKLGLSVEDAIFHPKYGAIKRYPSSIIESGMKVLIESAKKGPQIASQAIINVSNYIKEMHRVDERLKDLMADVISSMKSQIKFLTPVIAGIVMGITSMISTILGRLGERVSALQEATQGVSGGAVGTSLLSTFSGGGVATYWFQIIVGLYVVELVFILSILVNGIENGADKMSMRTVLGENLVRSTITYCLLTAGVVLAFNMVAANMIPT